MAQWDWLTKPETPYTWRFVRNVVIKGLILFVIANAIFALLNPGPLLGTYRRTTGCYRVGIDCPMPRTPTNLTT